MRKTALTVALLFLAAGAAGCRSTQWRCKPRVYETVVSERCIPIDCYGEPIPAPPGPRCGCVEMGPCVVRPVR